MYGSRTLYTLATLSAHSHGVRFRDDGEYGEGDADNIDRRHLVDGIQVEKVTTASQSKSSNVWI